jgi:endonuclease YncB( thermonuclease family)
MNTSSDNSDNSDEHSEPTELSECFKKNTPYFSLDGNEYKCKCISVYDGDTITVAFKPFDGMGFYKFRVRLSEIDTPEMRTKDIKEKEFATEVRDFLRELISDKIIKIKCRGFDKYGRLLAYVYTLNDDAEMIPENSVNYLLVEKNYAYLYDGGSKKEWKF